MISYVLGLISFICLLMAPAAVEGESYILALVMIVVMRLSAYGALREGGHGRKRK